jgi:signal transduction histidine kinase
MPVNRRQPLDLAPSDPVPTPSFLEGGGEMGARLRARDWSRTPLGPAEQWPQSLKTAVRILLTSRQPMFVWWGDELINLYNDAYRDIVGGKHPAALGQPAAVVWREIWDQVGPRAESALRRNEGTYDEALRLIMERHGYPEETYYTFSYSPVPGDQGGIGGILDGDLVRLSQVFANLLNNAAKYTEPGGHIRLAVEQQDGEVAVSVADDGIGIPAHRLPEVFELFTQVDPTLEKAQSGLGIGLTIVRQLVEMHGGAVVAQSAGEGHGSEFVVRLPVAPGGEAATGS